MSVEEKVIAKYEELKETVESIRKTVDITSCTFGDACDHYKYEMQLKVLSEILGIPYEYKSLQ